MKRVLAADLTSSIVRAYTVASHLNQSRGQARNTIYRDRGLLSHHLFQWNFSSIVHSWSGWESVGFEGWPEWIHSPCSRLLSGESVGGWKFEGECREIGTCMIEHGATFISTVQSSMRICRIRFVFFGKQIPQKLLVFVFPSIESESIRSTQRKEKYLHVCAFDLICWPGLMSMIFQMRSHLSIERRHLGPPQNLLFASTLQR